MIQRVQLFFNNLIGGGRLWGLLRLVIVAGIIGLFANWDRYIWNEPGSEPASLIWWWGLRFWVMPLAALAGAFLAGSLYLRRLHQLRRQRMASRYLIASAFSIGVPGLLIKDGQPSLAVGQDNLIWAIGGPGRLNVRPGSAVVVETLHKPTRVLGAGLHILTRLERLREIISLFDQHGMTEQVNAATKDGIEVNVQRIQYRYRLLTGRQPRDYRKRTTQDPYPFSIDAARKLAYQRTAFADGSVTPWDRVVTNAVVGVVTDYLNANQFDPATTPRYHENDPRAAMATTMYTRAIRERLRANGTELLWFDIGNFEPKYPEVVAQRLETWGATWTGLATTEEAYGEARRLSVQETARAEAQAEMLTGITQSLRQAGLGGGTEENLRQLIVMRTAQLLETMIEANHSAMNREVPEQPSSITFRRFKMED